MTFTSLDNAINVLQKLAMEYDGSRGRQGFVLNAIRELEALRHLESITKKKDGLK